TPTIAVADPAASEGWDLAVFATSVMLNGGAAGPGGVEGYCVCQNAAATDAAVQAMTPATELADFEAVTAAQAPAAADAWASDALSPAISGWYSYNPTTHVTSPAPEKSWLVRTAEGAAFAKFRVTGLAGSTQQTPGKVTIEYAVQPSAAGALGEVKTATIDVPATGRAYFDLATGQASTSADWDVAFEGWNIRVNGGVSGGGQAGAVAADQPFAAVTNAAAPPASTFRGDAYGGVFDAKKWYRYNLTGSDHQVWPTFDVYLVRRGAELWKVQLTGYYDASAQPRRITVRYAKLAG
ncbi:MAG TPA: HmuY family protein, partial [Longimicrobium sp.]|nr:HmuY family protein [Longimicrobium sp.]